MPIEWNKEMCKNLVFLIRERKCLYDRNLRPSAAEKEERWTEISMTLGMQAADLREKWKNMRTAYVKDLQNIRPSYYLHQDMDFLLPHVRSNKCKQLVSPNAPSSTSSPNTPSSSSSTSSDNLPVGQSYREPRLFDLPIKNDIFEEETVPYRPNNIKNKNGISNPGFKFHENGPEFPKVEPDTNCFTVAISDDDDIQTHTAQQSASSRMPVLKKCVKSQVKRSIITTANQTPDRSQNVFNSIDNNLSYPISAYTSVPPPFCSSLVNGNSAKSPGKKEADKSKASKGIKRKIAGPPQLKKKVTEPSQLKKKVTEPSQPKKKVTGPSQLKKKVTGPSQLKKKVPLKDADSRQHYLLSLLDDIKKLNDKQMLMFRKKVSDIIYEMLAASEGNI